MDDHSTGQRRLVAAAVDVRLRSKAALDGAMSRAAGAFDGLWLGLTGPTFLRALDEEYYRRQGEYIDDSYNLGGLHGWEQAVVDEWFPASGRVAVTGAGGGREVLALSDHGFDVMGYECNDRFVDFGSRLLAARGRPGRLALAPRDRWPAEGQRFDAVVVGWGSYMLVADRRARIEFLRGARASLGSGGPVLVSFYARTGSTAYLRALHRVGTACRRLRMRPPLLLGDALAPNFVHYFSRRDIEEELEAAGFDMVFFSQDPYGHAVGLAP